MVVRDELLRLSRERARRGNLYCGVLRRSGKIVEGAGSDLSVSIDSLEAGRSIVNNYW
jgi:hypothetical protein